METLSNYTPLILILLVFYFFILAPQLKRNKKEKQFAANLKKGDRVITKSGMHGKIAALNDKDTLDNRAKSTEANIS
jgi:preprotein translocase subunit YajC